MLKSSFFWLKAGILRYFNTENMQNPSKMSKNTDFLMFFNADIYLKYQNRVKIRK